MILRNVTLANYGLFGGEVSIDLSLRRSHATRAPVVLVGGRNGSGKTTLLEAIRLALYGRKALGSRVAQDEYNDFLRGRIHRPRDGSTAPNGASVAVTFDFAEDGRIRTYEVCRSWHVRGRSVVESLSIEQDGAPLSDIPREEWHFFVEDLIPSGVAQLFFFDGEKIQEMAEGHADEGHLADAIRGLLGIELVSRLRTDLGLFIARRSHDSNGRNAQELERVTRDLDTLGHQIEDLHEQVAHLATRRDSEVRAAEHARHRFVAEGGELAAKRAALELDLRHTRETIDKHQQELRDLANGTLPFAVAPKLTHSLTVRLSQAAESMDSRTKRVLTSQLLDTLNLWQKGGKLRGAPERSAKWSSAHWDDMHAFVQFWGTTDQDPVDVNPILGTAEREALMERLQHAERDVRPRLERISKALERAMARVAELEAKLLKADAASGNHLLDELQLAEQRVGALSATLASHEDQLSNLRGQRVGLEREQERILSAQARSKQNERTSQLAAASIAALGRYEDLLLQSKLDIVRREFLRCFQHLIRKHDLVTDIRIDSSTFAVTLVGSTGNEMPKDALSAGEKQIYATAMLWALARASGRPLPMLIDTPLARLDSIHREMLLTRYFPAASHQVILLSTDTEIDEEAVKSLSPAISHTFTLEYDPQLGSTRIERGYFWPTEHGSREYALL